MTCSVIYIYPRTNREKYTRAAHIWRDAYLAHPPGITPHDVFVVLNGQGGPTKADERLFSPIPVKFIAHTNVGKDIGAFQMMARTYPVDLQVCLGAHARPRRAGWLDLIVSSYLRHGPGLYGAYGFKEPALHIRTTNFWLPSELLNAYPHEIHNGNRYGFEHGARESILRFVKDLGLEAWMVTWRGTYPSSQFRHVENDEAIFLDQHVDTIGYK